MASFSIDIEYKEPTKQMNKLIKQFSKFSKLLKVIGQSEVKKAQDRIKSTKDTPDNQKWKPWDYQTIIQKQKTGRGGRGLLYDRGRLLNSFKTKVKKTSVTISNTARYAGYLQFGTRNMPARPYLGWNTKELNKQIEAYFK